MKIAGRWVLAGLAGALVGVPALAQEEQPTDPSIIVTEDRTPPTGSEVNRQARDVSDVPSDVYDRPLARVEDRLCPGVIGLRLDAAQLMIDRIRWNADRFDVRQGDDTECTPNLIIAFVDDGKAELAGLEERQPWLFQTMSKVERERLLAEDGPVRVWTTVQMRTRDGMPVARQENQTDPPVVAMWMAHSKIYLTIREDITQTVVLFDKSGVRGKTVIQLADYATMRSFARTRNAGGDAPLDTILALFDPNHEPPGGLTDFDQAYLRSVYNGIPNLPAITKINGVNSQLRRAQEAEEEDAE